MKKLSSGFTLIELLIVVAIIAILAAIAVPNFLEAQTRAKVSRCKNDMRTLAVACETYMTDHNKYPCRPTNDYTIYDLFAEYQFELTTPVAFLTTAKFKDPFAPKSPYWPTDSVGGYRYVDMGDTNGMKSWMYQQNNNDWGFKGEYRNAVALVSFGPDRVAQYAEIAPYAWGTTIENRAIGMGQPHLIYDPTNGTVSAGDIARWQGDMPIITTP